MSGLETLPPDQRAVLQLILKQGRGYADLAGLLKIDPDAVRARAHAGLDALVPADTGRGLPPERRGQVADYVLGQLDGEDAASTRRHLADSAAARRYAIAVRNRLAPLAAAALPEVPEEAPGRTTNEPAPPTDAAPGRARRATNEPAPATDADPTAPAPVGTAAPTPAAHAASAAPPPAWSAPSSGRDRRPTGRSSRLGGAILIAGAAIVVAVVVILLVTSGNDKKNDAAAPPASGSGTTSTTGTPQNIVGAANLSPVSDAAKAKGTQGIAVVQASATKGSGSLTIAIAAQKMPANGATSVFTVWLRKGSTDHFLGYSQTQVKATGAGAGEYAVTAKAPSGIRSYTQVIVSEETATKQHPGPHPAAPVLSGKLEFR